MTRITLDSKEVTSEYLVPLLKKLAEAIGWVGKQKRRITFEIHDDIPIRRSGATCVPLVPPTGRGEAEILIGILERMGEIGRRRDA